MRKLLSAFLFVLLFFGISFAQLNKLDFSTYSSIDDLKKEVENLTEGFHSGLNTLTWTDGSAPSVIGLSVSVFTGFGGADKNAAIGLDKDVFVISTAGIQAGFGTAGIEVFARFLPKMDLGDLNVSALGFGLKYDISDMIPAPGLPSTSLYVDYNTEDLKVNHIDFKLSSINIGTVFGYDFIVIGIYGRLGVELGNSELSWSTPAGDVKGDFSSTGFRYAVGLTAFGFRAEAGGRGSSTSVAVGYGISL